jgi:hypothetical protein
MRATVVLCCAVLVGTPTRASAQWIDFMDWLERLSGPRLRGGAVDFLLFCAYPDLSTTRFLDCIPSGREETVQETIGGRTVRRVVFLAQDRDDPRHDYWNNTRRFMVGFRAGYAGSGEDYSWFRGKNGLAYAPSATSDDKIVDVYSFGPTFTLPLFSSSPRFRGLFDLGWAVEANRFTGPSVDDFWIPSIDLFALTAKPFQGKAVLDAIKVRLRWRQFLGTFDSAQFGAAPGFEEKNERVWSLTLVVDPTEWVQRKRVLRQRALKLEPASSVP